MANEKPFNISPPNKKIETKANNVVEEVIIVRDKVSLIDKFVRSNTVSYTHLTLPTKA